MPPHWNVVPASASPELGTGRAITSAEIQRARAKGWTALEAAEHFGTTTQQVLSAERREGITLPSARQPAAPEALDLAEVHRRWTSNEASLSELARARQIPVSTLHSLLMRHALDNPGLGWFVPMNCQLYQARVRTQEATARLGLTQRGLSANGATWTTVIEEVGAEIGVANSTRAEQLAMKYAKRWARGHGLPWGRDITPPRWGAEEQAKVASQLRELLEAIYGPQVGALVRAASTEALLVMAVYGEHGALAALETVTRDPSRAYHARRAEAAGLVRAMAGLQGWQLSDLPADLQELLGQLAR